MKLIPLLLIGLSGLVLAAEPAALEAPPKGLASSDWSSIRAAYEAGRHAIQRQENGTLIARNPGQQWRTEFDGKGFLTTPDHGQWTWGLELTGYGERTLLSAPLSLTHEGNKISNQRDAHLTEWFINDTRGLEQGWTISSRSMGVSPTSSPLTLNLTLRGNLHPQVSPDSTSVAFQTASGSTALTYGGLKAWDADGKNLLVRFETAGETAIRIAVDDQNARYPITIDPIAQQAYLKASNTGAYDYFGWSVAVAGDTVVVGAPNEDSSTTGVNSTPNESAIYSGAAYVFTRSGTIWRQQAYLKASNTGEGDQFGGSVAVSGDTVVVGAVSEDSSATGVNSMPNESADYSGAAYVFTRSGGIWSQQAYLKASNTGAEDAFGISVSVSGDTVVVGAWGEDSSSMGVNSTPNNNATTSGAAYVFTRSGATWNQQAYLKASNTGADDEFGFSVAVFGDTVVVGAYGEDSSTTGVNRAPNESARNSGAAYIFTRSGTTWRQQANLKASNTGSYNGFGDSVAVSGDTVVVGASGENSSTTGVNSTPNESASASGAAYVFTRSGTTWSQQAYLKAFNTGADDQFGRSVAMSGDTVVVGAPREDSSTTGVNSTPNERTFASGAAYIFSRDGTTWSQQAYLKASNTGASDQFGWSVAVSGDTLVVGAYGEASSTIGVNSTPDENASASGAAYIFTGFEPSSQPPDIDQATSSGIIDSSNTLGATVTGQGSSAITGRGVVYSLVSTNPDPAIGGAGVTQLATSGTTGTFTISATGLALSSTYAFRAYATNSNGTSYTSVATFRTPPYFLTTSASNGTIQRNPDLASYAAGSVVTLTAVPNSGFIFQGWSGDLSGAANPATLTMDGNKTVTATFLLSLAGALDTSGLTYTTGGNANWFPQTNTTVDGMDAAQSGAIDHRQQTWFETTVTGPGSLSFRWKVSSESGYDYLGFYMDGDLQSGRISGNVDWATQSHAITAGSHILRWRYAKDGGAVSGSDAGWVDQIVWAPSGGYQEAAGAAGLSGNNALPDAIPFNDGVKNLLKYAFNMNLSGSDSRALVSDTGNSGLPAIGITGTGPATMIRVEFLRRKGSGLIYTPKRSSTLSPGSFVAMSGTPVVTSIDDNWERVVVQESADPATLPKSFAMVEVELP